jgi:hypothetical protein
MSVKVPPRSIQNSHAAFAVSARVPVIVLPPARRGSVVKIGRSNKGTKSGKSRHAGAESV